jgi:hypothetical protein
VREKLGKPRHDEFYSFLCEVGPHPRFRAAQLTGYMRVPPPDRPKLLKQAHLRIGPFDADQPDSLLAVLLILQQTAAVGIKMFWATDVSPDVTEADWRSAMAQSLGGLAAAAEMIGDELAKFGFEGVNELGRHYREFEERAARGTI